MEGSNTAEHARAASGYTRELGSAVSRLVQGRIKYDVSASSITTMAVGGPVQVLVTVESSSELQQVLALLHREQQCVYPFGFGSNIVVGDEGLPGWGIRLGASFRSVTPLGSGVFELGGACSLMSVSRKLSEEGFAGLEFAAGIPASLGGALFMNAGAHGAEIGACVENLRGILPDGTQHEWRGLDIPWRYRSSGLPAGVLITGASLRLVAGDKNEIAERCANNLAHRRATQPLSLPSSGSVFKNPSSEQTAGMLLEQAGLKGMSRGGAMVSQLHANWIVNPEKRARAEDVVSLIEACIARVEECAGVRLQPEVKVWR